MHAIQQNEWGGVDRLKLVEMSRPIPLPTEVLVKVKAAGINPVDVYTAQGKAYMRALNLPYVPGWDVAGIVEQVGYGTTRFKVGDEVFGMPWFPRAASAYAEYLVAPARHLALKPKQLSFEQAAALPLAGLTAWEMLVDIANVGRGDRVLINGAGGGVGHLAVQIAKARGAHVVAVASGAKHGFLRELGADATIDYTTGAVSDHVDDADVVIELVGGEICLQMLKTLRSGGLLISAQSAWAPQLKNEAEKLGVRTSWYLVEPNHVGLEALAQMAEQGSLRVEVTASYPLENAVEAMERVAGRRSTGKVVLTV
ncbi:NADP-dependent oxidoreductase [Bradyrhizobium elkanii]|nr:NADP-dependent oxidoreductase [Bradyrhizobium elkanii]RYM16699.1 NADP-dependent oxidoreductase [Bradyrhizobium elkanii]RYM17363.1 NADP-dependent oxidoreductase [Bradyrhizobium elkanii]